MVKELNDIEDSMTFSTDEVNIYEQEFNSISSSVDYYQIENSDICEDIQNPIDAMALNDVEILNKIQTKSFRSEFDKIQKWKKHCK